MTSPFFFYGTLRDADVRRLVLGYEIAPAALSPAWLSGFTVRHARGASYPILVAKRGSRAPGLLAAGLSRHDARLLDRFEGTGYRRVARTVASDNGAEVTAQVYLPRPVMRADERPWRFEQWLQRDKAAFLRRAAAAMADG